MTEHTEQENPHGWKRGYPPGPIYPGMVEDFEVYFSPGSFVWHRPRLRTPGERVAEEQKR